MNRPSETINYLEKSVFPGDFPGQPWYSGKSMGNPGVLYEQGHLQTNQAQLEVLPEHHYLSDGFGVRETNRISI